MDKKILPSLLICAVAAIVLLIISGYLLNIHPLSTDQKSEEKSSQFLVPEHEAYMQASAVSKLVPLYGGQYYNDADFWPESTVNETPLKLYDTNGILYQYIFTVSNETRKLGVIAVAANKSLGMPVMAIDDGRTHLRGSTYQRYYYDYDPEKSREELRDYIDDNYPDTKNPEIKDYIHDLFTVSAGFRPDNINTGENIIINNQEHIYNLSLTRWNRTTPVSKNYDLRYIPERVSEWEDLNEIFNKTYNDLILKGINLSRPLSKDETKYFTEFTGGNGELYNASNGCRPFSLPPVYPEDEPVSKLFPEYGFGSHDYKCLNLHFDAEIPDEEIKSEISGTINESEVKSIRIYNPETVDSYYVRLPVSKFNEIRTDLVFDAPPLDCYRVSDENITIFYSSRKDEIPQLIQEKYNATIDVNDAKVVKIRFDVGTDRSYILQEGKKLDAIEIVEVVGYGYS